MASEDEAGHGLIQLLHLPRGAGLRPDEIVQLLVSTPERHVPLAVVVRPCREVRARPPGKCLGQEGEVRDLPGGRWFLPQMTEVPE